MNSEKLGYLRPLPKTGTEPFVDNDQPLSFDFHSCWQWFGSDILSNTMRGLIAEYLVACDLGVQDRIRQEWAAYDLETANGVKVEVKSAAYLQSWHQKAISTISFGISPTTAWNPETGIYEGSARRQADVYVFALLHHRDKRTVNPLDVAQWTFYVLATSVLNRRLPAQKQVSLSSLRKLGPEEVRFGNIAAALGRVLGQEEQERAHRTS
ncbi:MAG TPA: hypothetical protein VE268_00215 [Herpetosiphonaceae bacterium]|nr:hypothetical protein [Herpetosiphonaceae bacterium]